MVDLVDRTFLSWKKRIFFLIIREYEILWIIRSGSKFTRMRYLLIILFVFNALLTDKCVSFSKEKNFAMKHFFRIFLLNVLSNFLSPERSNFEVSKANTFFFLHFTSVFKIQNQTCLTEKEMIEFERGVHINQSSKRYNSTCSPFNLT